MSDYQKNVEVIAHSIALMLAPTVVLSDDDSFNAEELELNSHYDVIDKMAAEYLNDVEVSPDIVRTNGVLQAYSMALFAEFNNHISDSCEEWIRKIQNDDNQK